MILTRDTETEWRALRWFLPAHLGGSDRLACPCGCDLLAIDRAAMMNHDQARENAGIPFRVPEGGGCRCEDYQETLRERYPDAALPTRSSHVPRDGRGSTGLDVSLRSRAGAPPSSGRRGRILEAYYGVGCERLGVTYDTFVHADWATDLPRPVAW